jgi:MazG family protein
MSRHLEALQKTIHTLRSPGGCPWDRKQSLRDAAGYLLEEAGELLDAAVADDLREVREELGDLLFMVCFCVEILAERQPVSLADVAREGNEKLVRRHPHVFAGERARDSSESQVFWDEIKAREKRARGLEPGRDSVLKELSASASPLTQAQAYQQSAAEVGFDWPDRRGVWDKVAEEIAELREASQDTDGEAVAHEVGDLLFAVVNLARWLDIPADLALRSANQRFRNRFAAIEAAFGHDRERLRKAGLDRLEAVWQQAKRYEETTGDPAAGE